MAKRGKPLPAGWPFDNFDAPARRRLRFAPSQVALQTVSGLNGFFARHSVTERRVCRRRRGACVIFAQETKFSARSCQNEDPGAAAADRARIAAKPGSPAAEGLSQVSFRALAPRHPYTSNITTLVCATSATASAHGPAAGAASFALEWRGCARQGHALGLQRSTDPCLSV